jgi:hypothetical protein
VHYAPAGEPRAVNKPTFWPADRAAGPLTGHELTLIMFRAGELAKIVARPQRLS